MDPLAFLTSKIIIEGTKSEITPFKKHLKDITIRRWCNISNRLFSRRTSWNIKTPEYEKHFCHFWTSGQSGLQFRRRENSSSYLETNSVPQIKWYRLTIWWKNEAIRVEEIRVWKSWHVTTNSIFRHCLSIEIPLRRKKQLIWTEYFNTRRRL